MAWQTISLDEVAKRLKVNRDEVRDKQQLMLMISKFRKEKRISQAVLAKKLGLTQARISQIESGVGTKEVSFDVLFKVLQVLGYDYRIQIRKAA